MSVLLFYGSLACGTGGLLLIAAALMPLRVVALAAPLGDRATLLAAKLVAGAARPTSEQRILPGASFRVIAALPPKARPGPPSQFLVALSEAVIAPAGQAVDRATLLEVAGFLAEQIGSLPGSLRLMFALGMGVFRAYVRVRRLAAFDRLDVDRRRAAVHAWAFGSIPLFRDLFRPVRSIALFAYHERGR